jgi:hypothetical protein
MPKKPKKPQLPELEFLREVPNHNEFFRKLDRLGLPDAGLMVRTQAHKLGLRWLRLGTTHLREARAASKAKATRAAYSRAYYAAYNASKAVRYITAGFVSLKGDDHQKAAELPGDFPDAAKWSQSVTRLYEQRLRADYDNWRGVGFTMDVRTAVDESAGFVAACKAYLRDKFELNI